MSRGLRGARAVSYSQVSGGDVVPCDNRLLERNNLVRSEVRVEVGLDVLEDRDRTVSASTANRSAQEPIRVLEYAADNIPSRRVV